MAVGLAVGSVNPAKDFINVGMQSVLCPYFTVERRRRCADGSSRVAIVAHPQRRRLVVNQRRDPTTASLLEDARHRAAGLDNHSAR